MRSADAGGVSSGPRLLEDIRVLDVSRVVSGPFAGRLLTDLGADVVKVEPPRGDETRAYGLRRGGLAGSYVQQNVGKSNVCVDLKAPGGRELLLRLAERADIMLENFRPGVMARLGIDWTVLQKVNPGLILLSITGFGQEGPASGRKAYAPVIHAETGLVARQAFFDDRAPSDPMPSIADTNASLHGLVAVLAALHLRSRTGAGQHIDVSMAEAMLTTDDYSHHALDGHPIVRVGGDVWEAVGGQVLTAGLFAGTWDKLTARFGDVVRGRAADPTSTAAQMAAVQQWVSTFTDRVALEQAFEDAEVAWAAVRPPMDVFDSDWARHRRTWCEVDDRAGGTRRVVESPYHFSDAVSGVVPRVAHRGEDNATVLHRWLGAEDAEVASLLDGGVLQQEPDPALAPAAEAQP